MIVEVAIPIHVHQTFTYLLPEDIAQIARPGCRVLVPLGNQMVTGYIVALAAEGSAESANETYELKAVEQLFDDEPLVTGELLELTRWISDYYYAPWGEVIKSSLPAGINQEAESILVVTESGRRALETASPRARVSSKMRALALIADSGSLKARDLARESSRNRASALARELEREGWITSEREIQSAQVRPKLQHAVRRTEPDSIESVKPLTAPQERVLDLLSSLAKPANYTELAQLAGVSSSVIRTLEKRGFVEVFEREVRRNPLAHLGNSANPEVHALGSMIDDLILTPKQQAAFNAISAQMDTGQYAAFLLHGLTGSGKTEVYMRAMRSAVDRGKTALMLVPEISLTPMFARRLRAHFGEAIAILHSSLSDGERLDEWNRLRHGHARVCIGARSAIFAPLDNLGVIVVDEEHEGSYKQEESPRYHSRDTAILRASRAKAVVILGSATPSMESFHNARAGKYQYLQLDERIGGKDLAQVEIVDMRDVFARHGKAQIFSDELKEAIKDNFTRQEQTMVLLNRRGFSSYVLCRSCGTSVRCPDCDVSLTYHKLAARLICHYCGHQARVPQSCPDCSGKYIHFVGEGTEQIESMLREMYPELRIARLDRDTTRQRGSFERVLGAFAAGEIDLLVGTQMIAKGHDFQNVTLVCVISVDGGLAMPDFRAAERTFQLLTQVAGRAGRGDKAGRVLIQSYHPEHYALDFARAQLYEKFFEHEIHFRREMRYPPFSSLINVMVRHREYNTAAQIAAELTHLLKSSDSAAAFRVLGPATAPIGRLKGEHRLQVLIKTSQRNAARAAMAQAMQDLRAAGHDLRQLSVDVDPVNLM
ncbi:MAG: primosomal protein N' [Acidobacteriota bacterium]